MRITGYRSPSVAKGPQRGIEDVERENTSLEEVSPRRREQRREVGCSAEVKKRVSRDKCQREPLPQVELSHVALNEVDRAHLLQPLAGALPGASGESCRSRRLVARCMRSARSAVRCRTQVQGLDQPAALPAGRRTPGGPAKAEGPRRRAQDSRRACDSDCPSVQQVFYRPPALPVCAGERLRCKAESWGDGRWRQPIRPDGGG